ncbi:hypothetical protein [uncultured Methanospirillum sp.]|uniref:hypothetical protein n=1 Tax=uncultured Methanospirillum sp. TaxID=262503 RepID=UPI0029C65C96|nr:hypothetical protein [uncultured Methanospirillum sp.]
MDLAQSILKELITLQSKNEELARIITKLEHESDIIIRQFETKIEELQKSLKHEQDDKSRAARRYDAEIHTLEEARDALINEISEVRNTFQTRVHGLEEKIQLQVIDLDEKEKESAALLEEKDNLAAVYDEKITSLQISLADQAAAARHEQDLLSSQSRALAETLKQDRDRFTSLVKKKEEDLHTAGEALRAMDQRLHEYADREKALEEQSRETVEHLHRLINTERQIRTRELKERDLLEKGLEEQLRSSRQALTDLENRYKEDTGSAAQEIERLQNIFSDESVARRRFEQENLILSDRLTALEKEYDEKLAGFRSEFLLEKESLLDQVNRLHEELQSVADSHTLGIRARDEEISSLIKLRNELQDSLRTTAEENQQVQDELAKTILQHGDVKARLEQAVSSAESEVAHLQSRIGDLERSLRQENEHLVREIAEEKKRSAETELTYLNEIACARNELEELGAERDHLLSESRVRDDYFRDEISGLHQELADLQATSRAQEEALRNDIALRERQILDLFTNNEALRAEIDRVRHQYIKLQETIRAEKDESVHALYREITTLEGKLAGRDREIATLSENNLRLDAENTRLIQQVSPEPPVAALPSPVVASEPVSPQVTETAPDPGDPRRKEVLTLATELEDPAMAPDAAAKLAAMGHGIVDHLIPLLHTGSIQRRVWIAVVLYEINDNRATLPLMRLLETPKVHFRELIWEAKNQYRTRIRSGAAPGEPVVRQGLMGPGF